MTALTPAGSVDAMTDSPTGRIRQWAVRDPHGPQAVFEDAGAAWAHAGRVASATDPSVVRDPDGLVHLVFRHSDLVEVSTRRMGATTRRVVEL